MPEVRDPATGLVLAPLDGLSWDHFAIPNAAMDGLSVDDPTYEATEAAVFAVWEAGDPDDRLNATVVLKDVTLLGGEA